MGVGQSDRDSARVPVRGHNGGQTKRGLMHAVTRRVPECSVCRKVRMTPHGSSHKRVSDVEDLMSHDQRDDDQRACGSGSGRR